MGKKEHTAKYEGKLREKGVVRGPRLTAEASDQLRRLCYLHRMTPMAMASKIIMQYQAPENASPAEVHGLSLLEVREFERHGAKV